MVFFLFCWNKSNSIWYFRRRRGFALIFTGEYASILFMRIFLSLMFLGGKLDSMFFYSKIMFVVFMFIWVRGTLPRLRCDKLIYLEWKSFILVSLNYIFFFCWNWNVYFLFNNLKSEDSLFIFLILWIKDKMLFFLLNSTVRKFILYICFQKQMFYINYTIILTCRLYIIKIGIKRI